MQRQIFLAVLLLLLSMPVWAQQVKVSYEYPAHSLSVPLQEYFQMQGVQHLRLIIRGEFNGKRATFQKVSCRKGVFTERELLPDFFHFILEDSVETLDFMAVPYKEDSLRVTCFHSTENNMPLFTDTVRIDKYKILMETYTPGDGPETPIMSYTSGIPIEGGFYFCGLRSSGVEPRKWYEKLEDGDRKKLVRNYMEKCVTLKAFKSVVKHILRMKLNGTTVRSNPQRLAIDITFKEDPNAMPINLEMRLPSIYPLEAMSIHTDIGDMQMSATCDSKIMAAMKGSQSVEEGVRTWHAFVVERVLDSPPCTICYSYFDTNHQTPQVHCATCDNAFHKNCLTKWFERCHSPICPFCACPWHRR